ncbi:MAG: YebC/PmpR family DNA-binding transcriptional regulator, partial [Actinobacteria bacterium]|nr:YebC/PmpR family DNA-binding transcriptional regulator [Actinomycetota bacterium]
MSGHSKWATIKHKKAAIDKVRGKTFAKLSRLLEVAARDGGGDVSINAALRTVVSKAKAAQMTNDAIDRAIKRGMGETDGKVYESVTYEAYAPGGVAMLIDILTDNRNRTAADVRIIFSKQGGAMAAPGAVGWQFARKGVILVAKSVSEDDLMLVGIDHGLEDITADEDMWHVTCDPS